MTSLQDYLRYVWCALGALFGWLWFHFAPTIPFHTVVVLFIVYDAWTAFKLDKRVHAKYPDQTPNTGHFTSFLFGKVVRQTIPERLWAILLAYTAEHWVFTLSNGAIVYIVTGAILIEQTVSILENSCSCREDRDGLFYKILKKILVDKTARHLGDGVAKIIEENGNNTDNHSSAGPVL